MTEPEFEAMQHREIHLPKPKDSTPAMFGWSKKQKLIDSQTDPNNPKRTSIEVGRTNKLTYAQKK